MNAEKQLKGAEVIFLTLLTIGLIGLLFLIIYGNLSGNLGWSPDSASYTNQTINLSSAGGTPAGAQNRIDGYYDLSTVVVNLYNGTTIGSGNYTITELVINATTDAVEYYNSNVNVSFTVYYDGSSEIHSENVISNLTSGATQFFTFSNVWFILTAVTVLIGIVLGVIALVRKASGSGGYKAGGRSEFPN